LRILDVGCGIKKAPGAIGIDRNPASAADVLCDLDRFPYPFADSSFDGLQAVHVIEHLADVIRAMEEFHRLVRAGAVSVWSPRITPTSAPSAIPPTAGTSIASPSAISESATAGSATIPRQIPGDFRHVKLLAFWRMLGLEFLVNRFRRFRLFWEHYCCYVCEERSSSSNSR